MASFSFKSFVEQELGKFPHFLIYAVLEWILIIILFIDGFLAFIANEFAKFFELKLPCLLCTRIDHVLVRKNPDFYYNESICEAHKKDVSYLAYCHAHRKLSDIRKMCEGCLLSFATEKESDTGTYKSLVGILHKDLECFVEDDHQIQLKLPAGRRDDDDHDEKVEESSVHRCSCCGAPMKVKSSYSKEIVQGSANKRSLLSQTPAPSPRAPFVTFKNEESRNLELPHIRYTELKFISDNEPEMPEYEDSSNAIVPENQGKEDGKAVTMPLLTESEDLNEDPLRTPNFTRGNRFFGIPLTDSASASASASPRWTSKILRKSPLEKTEFASDSIEASASIEVDGESILHRLKRQVRLDRKSLMALYMELDEERSASAVAANNAMAMITRLQAEKAAVQMEALQYQRMMEEQAEYDQEALQVMKDFLTKKEDELKVLEVELEAYKEKYGTMTEHGFEESESQADGDYQDMKSQSNSPCSEISEIITHYSFNEHSSNRAESSREENGVETYEESPLDHHGERSHFLDQLKNLERKVLPSFLGGGVHSSESSSNNVDHSDKDRGFGSKTNLTRVVVSDLTERVKAVEEDSGFLNHAATTVMKFLSEDTDA